MTLWSANSWIRERKHLSKTEWAIVIAIGYAVALLRAKWILFRS